MYLDQKGIGFDSQALPRFTTKGHSWKGTCEWTLIFLDLVISCNFNTTVGHFQW